MFSICGRVAILAAALFLLAPASRKPPVASISAHGTQPHSHAFVAGAHGMMGSNKHQFDSIHHFAAQKSGHHGFSNGTTNKRKH